MRRVAAAALAAAAVLAAAGPLVAQAEMEPPRWSAELYYDVTQISPSPDEAYWQTVTAGVGRRSSNGSVAVQGLVTRRFEVSDAAVIADVYHDLWSGAYGNVRIGVAPAAEALSRFDAGAELYQALGNAELSASFRHQSFEVSEVNTLGVGLAYYIGNWYLRPRGLAAQVDESWSPFLAFTARRYLGDTSDNLMELAVGIGEEVLEVAAPASGTGPLDVITSGSRFVSLRSQRYFGRRFGVSASTSYSDYEEIPNRWRFALGVLTRW